MQHRWKEVEVPKDLSDTFAHKYVCIRGDCRTEKLVGRDHVAQYIRERQFYTYAPECYGDTPLNEQTID